MLNRGRKGRPLWCVEDFNGLPETANVGKLIYSDSRKGVAEGFMKQMRQLERDQEGAK